ncbi:snorna binding [Pyrenophora seminiperda CCB06]|uniref:Snorna binding n=1 Tax=Pyrenophora seminiperda CCB06 TaxID=1302712 RepID=A0A3M7M1Q6_9PLEO|nr:snorna binding [Pyrenophora seminiperda CCB06]
MAEGSKLRAVFLLVKNLFLAALLYGAIYGLVTFINDPSVAAKGKIGIPAFLDKAGPTELLETTRSGVKVKFAGTTKTVTINPHANVFNRPVTAVKIKDDYLGPRPHVDTEADIDMLIEECRGTYAGIEKMRRPFDCLKFFAEGEDRYYSLPKPADRASAQDPRNADFIDADGHGKTLKSYTPIPEAVAANGSNIGTCPGPIIPYHVYWTGPATWRVEVFIKSYLYTQNLACSRLWLWLDSDRNPKAVYNMLNKDALFARFLPLVERGDIVVKAWNFPSRIPLATDKDDKNGFDYYSTPGTPNSRGEKHVAENIVEDKTGQQWLVLTQKQMTFLPVAVSDAVRFIVLHIYGGAYFDMDVLMLRDMRPLLLPKEHAFAERWAAHPHPGDYNTAIMSLSANSSLSSYLLYGGIRMGVNFHPRVLGRMAWKDGRDQEFKMFETAAFDPIWTEFNWDREGRCTVPCIRDYGAVFKGKIGGVKDEWESYDGPQLDRADLKDVQSKELKMLGNSSAVEKRQDNAPASAAAPAQHHGDHPDSFQATLDEEAELRKAGVISDYVLAEDKYPPNNRTLENFFRGAWTYHIHNQVSATPILHQTRTPPATVNPALLGKKTAVVGRVAQPATQTNVKIKSENNR